MSELQCGPECWTPDEPHAEPVIDWIGDWPLAHGESERPVPGTDVFNGLYTPAPDAYCLCGHPNYMTCPRWISEGLASMTFSAVTQPTQPEE